MILERTRSTFGLVRMGSVLVLLLALLAQTGFAAAITTFTAVSPAVPVNIASAGGGIGTGGGITFPVETDSTITVSGLTSCPSKVTVAMYLPDQFPHHLQISLRAPDNVTEVILKPRVFVGNDNFMGGVGSGTLPPPQGLVVFDDAATVSITNGGDNIPSGTYLPANPLARFKGMPVITGTNTANGVWTLRIISDSADTGTIQFWSMTIWTGYTWTGAGADSNWSTATNWSPEQPVVGSLDTELIFPATSGNTAPVKDLGGNFGLLSLSSAGSYTFTGSGVQFEGTGLIDSASGTSTWALPTTLNNGNQQVMVESGQFSMTGVIGGTGNLSKTGTGVLSLTAANTFTGPVSVNGGILSIGDPAALGTTAGRTTVQDGATLQMASNLSCAEPLTIAGSGFGGLGSLDSPLGGTWTGPIVLSNGSIGVDGASSLTINGTLTGTGLSKVGTGTLVIGSALPANVVLGVTGTVSLQTGATPLANLGALTMTDGTLSGAGTVALSGTLTVGAGTTGSIINATTLSLGTGAQTFNVADGASANDLLINSAITGTGSIVKTGAGTLTIDGAAGTEAVAVNSGRLSGSGTIGALTVGTGAEVKPGDGAGNLACASATFASGSVFTVVSGTNQLTSTGTVDLGGDPTTGVGGAILRPFITVGTAGTGQTIISTTGTRTNVFNALPVGTSGIAYNPGSVVLTLSGATVAMGQAAYTVNEGAGTLTVTVVTAGTGSVSLATLNGAAVLNQNFGAPSPSTPVAFSGGQTLTFTVPIINDFVAQGDHGFYLLAVPSGGASLAAPDESTVTIQDDDSNSSHKKKCGFGSGFTVFYLFGFGLLLRVLGLRRR